ncbi:MAG: NAD(P)-dependent oxidoreductase, partial [Candidatus Cloacimonadota bacterium]|nr:NAD(P)-dependent oxidoreductase [Candidatus Cloacimonadota bacterium]
MPQSFWQLLQEKRWQHFFTSKEDKNAQIAIIRTYTDFNKEKFEQFPKLKLIIRAGTGYDNIDLAEAKKREVTVCHTPNANAISAAEHTIAFIASMVKHQQLGKQVIAKYQWRETIGNSWEFTDLKVLIIGLGRVGYRVAKILKYLGAQVKAYDPYLNQKDWQQNQVEEIELEAGLSWCNLISFHTPLTSKTYHYFSMEMLNSLQQPFWLVNTARGRVVDIEALKLALHQNKLLGAALDVFPQEPYKMPNF